MVPPVKAIRVGEGSNSPGTTTGSTQDEPCENPGMPLDEIQVHDLLFGDTDPREVALFLAQKSLTMDAVERDQRMVVLHALDVHATRELAQRTFQLVSETRRMASWTRAAVFVAGGGSLVASVISIVLAVQR